LIWINNESIKKINTIPLMVGLMLRAPCLAHERFK
jgi:hypothetical protein